MRGPFRLTIHWLATVPGDGASPTVGPSQQQQQPFLNMSAQEGGREGLTWLESPFARKGACCVEVQLGVILDVAFTLGLVRWGFSCRNAGIIRATSALTTSSKGSDVDRDK